MTRPEYDEDPPLEVGIPDTGDLVDPAAPDPTDPEVTDRSDPNWVAPAVGVSPIQGGAG